MSKCCSLWRHWLTTILLSRKNRPLFVFSSPPNHPSTIPTTLQLQNRMLHSIEIFGNLCISEYFTETAFILFLNKKGRTTQSLLVPYFHTCSREDLP